VIKQKAAVSGVFHAMTCQLPLAGISGMIYPLL